MHYCFGEFDFNTRAFELTRAGERLRIQQQPLQLLALLLEHAGETVTREELRQRLWPQDTFVDFDLGVNVALRKLRKVLEDSATAPRFILTIPRQGYRFIAPVTVVNADKANSALASETSDRQVMLDAPAIPRSRVQTSLWITTAGVCLLLLASLVAARWLMRRSHYRRPRLRASKALMSVLEAVWYAILPATVQTQGRLVVSGLIEKLLLSPSINLLPQHIFSTKA